MNLIDMRTAPPRHLWKTWQPRTQPITAVTITPTLVELEPAD